MTKAPEIATPELTCGLVMPISSIDGCSETHWEEVRSVIREALSGTPFAVVLVSDANEVGVIQKRIIQNLYDNAMVICDVSAKNPNVMFELGMRLAFDKPTIIIKDDQTKYSFDTAPIEHLEYPRGLHYHLTQAFKTKLRDKVLATYEASKKSEYTTFLKNFGQFVVAKLDEKKVGKDDYVIAALAEVREEVRSLSRQTALRREKESIAIGDLYPSRERLNSILLKNPEVWIKTYLETLPSSTDLENLTRLDSPEFNGALKAYLGECFPRGVKYDRADIETIKRSLLGAINRHLSA